MEIRNAELARKLEAGEPVKLELGGGEQRNDGCYCLDVVALDGVDVVADLNKPLSAFPDNSVSYVYSRHVLEHIDELDTLMAELRRIVRPDGKLELIVPHFSNPYHYSDPTHVRAFGLYSMHYYANPEDQPGMRKVPAFYNDIRFRIESVKVEFYRSGPIDYLIAPWLEPLVNTSMLSRDFYERRLSRLFHAWQLRWILRPS